MIVVVQFNGAYKERWKDSHVWFSKEIGQKNWSS